MLPPLPAWDASHPLVVHFPIALLLAAPALVVLGLLLPGQRGWLFAALTVMALGTAGAFLAAATGEAGENAAESIPAAKAVLDRHEDLAELARNLFLGLTALFAGSIAAAHLLGGRWRRAHSLAAGAVFLLAYAGACTVLINAAHEGGRLVHEFGVRAALATGATGTGHQPSADADE